MENDKQTGLIEVASEENRLLAEGAAAENSADGSFSSHKRKKINFEMILLVLLGFLIGVVVKTEASQRITIGYEDYLMTDLKQGYDVEKIEKSLVEKLDDNSDQEGAIE